ncbi:hypothetical protein SAMN04490370_11929 [Eubacterium ruminantium]|nr:hypothetical protein SAMN04490370_11929 [Eubacterium ruminantium]
MKSFVRDIFNVWIFNAWIFNAWIFNAWIGVIEWI